MTFWLSQANALQPRLRTKKWCPFLKKMTTVQIVSMSVKDKWQFNSLWKIYITAAAINASQASPACATLPVEGRCVAHLVSKRTGFLVPSLILAFLESLQSSISLTSHILFLFCSVTSVNLCGTILQCWHASSRKWCWQKICPWLFYKLSRRLHFFSTQTGLNFCTD